MESSQSSQPGNPYKLNSLPPTKPYEILRIALFRLRVTQTQLLKMLRARDVFILPSTMSKILKGDMGLDVRRKYFISEVLGVPDEILFPDLDRTGWALARLFGITKHEAMDT